MAIAIAAKEIVDDGMSIAVGGGLEFDLAGAERQDEPLSAPWTRGSPTHRDDLYMSMLETAEIVAERYHIPRERQDEYALQSHARTAAGAGRRAVRGRDRPAAEVMKVTDKATGAVSKRPSR